MSSALYALGHWAARAKWLVLVVWIALLAVLAVGAVAFGKGANAPISIPGTESQAAISRLAHTFPEVSGTSATIIVVSPEGKRVDTPAVRDTVLDAVADLEELPGVIGVQTPFGEIEAANSDVSPDGRALLMLVRVDGAVGTVGDEATSGIERIAAELGERLPAGSTVSYGGEMYSTSIPSLSPTEAVGVLVAFVVLLLALGSLLAAGMPLLIALVGVGVSIAGLFLVTAFVELTSTTPMLALMLGLAVGIDYTLFIVSRHQEQLRAGVPVRESIARATATSGSAVVFAGLTVIIALVGLAVARIPFLTALGVAAAVAVGVAVLIAITLTPAVLSMVGERILPRRQRTKPTTSDPSTVSEITRLSRSERFFTGWVRAVTRRPLVTIVAVLVALGIASVPALSLRLALPDATSLPHDDPARVTYELTGEHFGEGFNAPLLLTGSIISSTDPLGLVDDLKAAIERVPGVADVPLATPNQGADTVIIQVIPEEGAHAASTSALVQALRDHHDEWEQQYGVSLAVTGFTAVGIDVSAKLFNALIPFGVLVVGLSLILLAMVFRSIWVPIKATLGYLLSVGAAFGAVVAVFQWGWFGELLHVHSAGPVLSFMPIILMGVLFGLAMDYEVFLVSRMREEYVHGRGSGDAVAQRAIHRGFVGSAKVVTAAALIMFAVFAAFVPEGDPSIKIIALGLAVGVFVDAFVVRMTLVPAVLALLGERAWRMPRWIARALPSFDVEGEGLARELEHASWPPDAPDAAIASAGLVLGSDSAAVPVPDLRLRVGEALLLDPRDPASLPLAEALSGRGRIVSGTLKVSGLLLPERASSLRARAAWASVDAVGVALRDDPEVLVLDLRAAAIAPPGSDVVSDARTALAERAAVDAAPIVVVLGEAELAGLLLPLVILRPQPLDELGDRGSRQRRSTTAHAEEGAR